MTQAQLSHRIARDFANDPQLYPHTIDLAREAVLILDAPWRVYCDASFLDDRLFQAKPAGLWTREDGFVTKLAADAPPPAGLAFIFHIGHCGSTLLSRLLATKGDAAALREPQPLRAIAEADADRDTPWDPLSRERREKLIDALLRCWSRKPEGVERMIVKVTSMANGVAGSLLSRAEGAPAIALSMGLEAYLAALLAPEEPSPDLTLGARARFSRFARELGRDPGWRLHALSPGELAAASWMAETHSLESLAALFPDRVVRLDFDAFLAAPGERLLEAARHSGLDWSEADATAALESGIMQQYSKAPEHGYDTDFRRRVLEDSRTRNADEIERGRNFANDALDRLGLDPSGAMD